ncbi:MAG: Ammonium transporter, partial [uncultured Rubrobacteraceae bacterium]
ATYVRGRARTHAARHTALPGRRAGAGRAGPDGHQGRAGPHLGHPGHGPRLLHAGRLPAARDRLLAREERGGGGGQDPGQLLHRHHRLVGPRVRPGLRRLRRLRRRLGLLPVLRQRGRRRGGRPLRRDVRRRDLRVLRLPVHVLRRLPGDRLGHDARAHQVHRLPDLRRGLRRPDLPAHRPLGLRRRALLGRQLHRQRGAGLRGLLRGPPHGRHRGVRGAPPARAAQGQVRARRPPAGDPGPQHAALRPRGPDPLARLVRVQRRLDAQRERRALRGDRHGHEPRRGRWRRRRDGAGVHPLQEARRRHGRQRRDRRPGRDHRAVGVRGVLGGAHHRLRRRPRRRGRRPGHRQVPRRPGGRAVGARAGGDLGHAGLRHLHLRPPRGDRRHRRPRPALRRRADPARGPGRGRRGHLRGGLHALLPDLPGHQGDGRPAGGGRHRGGRP